MDINQWEVVVKGEGNGMRAGYTIVTIYLTANKNKGSLVGFLSSFT